MRHVGKPESLGHADLQFSTLDFYLSTLLHTGTGAVNGNASFGSSSSDDGDGGGGGDLILNPLYNPPRARDRRFQYLRPRCSGPHDLELWRDGLCGFINPHVGVLSDPTSYAYTVDERLSHHIHRTSRSPHGPRGYGSKGSEEDVTSYARNLVEETVEDVLDRLHRSYYHEVKSELHHAQRASMGSTVA